MRLCGTVWIKNPGETAGILQQAEPLLLCFY